MDHNTKRPIGGNIFLIVIAGVILLVIPFQIDGRQVADSLGARAFPYIATALVLIPNLLQLMKKIIENRRVEQEGAAQTVKTAQRPLAVKVKEYIAKYWILVTVMALAFLATFVINSVGYVVTYSLLTCAMLLLFREKRWYFYLISVVLVMLVFLFFTKFLYVPLPSPF